MLTHLTFPTTFPPSSFVPSNLHKHHQVSQYFTMFSRMKTPYSNCLPTLLMLRSSQQVILAGRQFSLMLHLQLSKPRP